MTKDEYRKFYVALVEEAAQLCFQKQEDYTGTTDDPFSNMRLCETFGICSLETGILTRLMDKTQRRIHLIQKGEASVEDETLRDTIIDEINYLVFLAAALASKAK